MAEREETLEELRQRLLAGEREIIKTWKYGRPGEPRKPEDIEQSKEWLARREHANQRSE